MEEDVENKNNSEFFRRSTNSPEYLQLKKTSQVQPPLSTSTVSDGVLFEAEPVHEPLLVAVGQQIGESAGDKTSSVWWDWEHLRSTVSWEQEDHDQIVTKLKLQYYLGWSSKSSFGVGGFEGAEQ